MTLPALFLALADIFDSPAAIEQQAAEALRAAAGKPDLPVLDADAPALARPFLDIIAQADAHPVCALISQMPFHWAPPTTSDDPAYIAHSKAKIHAELLGPDGLVRSDKVRLGLYGMLPGADYGLRTHLAEEVFIMLAGEALWKRGDAPYLPARPTQRSYHPSGLPHATRTDRQAFLSVYVWSGDLSTDSYVYTGIPAD